MMLAAPPAPIELCEPAPVVGLTRGLVAAADAERERIAMVYRYLRAVERMRTARTARHVAR